MPQIELSRKGGQKPANLLCVAEIKLLSPLVLLTR